MIGQSVLAQPSPQWNPTFGLIGIEKKRGDKVNLVFTHICQGETDGKSELKHCEKTVEDDDGLASLIAVQAMLKQHYECGSHRPEDTVPNWQYIKEFLMSRLNVLVKNCQEKVCKTRPKGLGQFNGYDGQQTSALKFCGDTYKKVQALKNTLNKEQIKYSDLNDLADFLIETENFHSEYKVKTKYDKGRGDETQRERLLVEPYNDARYSNIAQIFNKYQTSENDPHSLKFTAQGQGGVTTITREMTNEDGQKIQVSQHYCYHFNNYESPQSRSQGIAEYLAALTHYYNQDRGRNKNWWHRHRDRLRDRTRNYTPGGGLPRPNPLPGL